MPFPKRPRGEKPTVTIRWQHRQMVQMEQTITRLSRSNDSNERRIDAQEVELDEAATREGILIEQVERSADQCGTLLAIHQKNKIRLAYLEGYYYAKTTEANCGSGAGNTRALQDGAPAPEEARSETITGRDGASSGGQIRGIRPGYSAHSDRRPLAEGKVGGENGELA